MNRFSVAYKLMSLCLLVAVMGCTPKTIPQKTDEVDWDFSDDLSQYRPEVPELSISNEQEPAVIENDSVRSPYDISKQLNVLLDTIRQRNFETGELEGYTILVYSGTNETEAGRIRNRLYDIVPDLEARVKYTLPTYFVKIGRFYQQIEAQSLYLKVRKFYPDATIVPDKFPIE